MNYSLIVVLFVIIKICAGDPGAINRIRNHVIQWAESNANDVHPADLEKVKSQDAFIGNYLRYHNNNEVKAQQALEASLRYFKTQGFHDMNAEYFPSEFHATGAMNVLGHGIQNQPLFSSLQRCMLPVASNGQEIYKQFIKYCLYKYWKLVQGDASRSHIVHLAFKNAFPLNVDIPLVKDTAPNLIEHIYMHRIQYLISDASILIDPLVRLTMTILQVKNVRYIKETELSQYVALETVATRYGGTNHTIRRMPAGAKSGRCLPHLSSVPAQQWASFTKQNKVCIHEGMQRSGIASEEQYLRHC